MPNDGGDYETLDNEERGCGFLKHSKAYLRSPARASEGGVLPPFVEFDPPVPYLERDKFRGYEFFPGVPFELAVTGAADVPEVAGEWLRPEVGWESDDVGDGYGDEIYAKVEEPQSVITAAARSEDGLTSTDPPGEVWRHVARSTGDTDAAHAGDVRAFHAPDLYMHVGKSYYETPEEFIEEVREQGLSKAIPVSQSQEPPVVDPGKTRLFLVHPKACGEDTAGVIGYVYLSRTVYTEDAEGRFPNWAKKQARSRGDMDLVRIGDQIYDDGTRATQVDGEWTEVETTPDDYDEEPDTVQPSDKDGRDVETVEETEEDDDEAEENVETHTTSPDPDASQGHTGGENGDPFEEVEFVTVERPDECPECGSEVNDYEDEQEGHTVELRECSFCEWNNWDDVNAALAELDFRSYEFNKLRTVASDRGISTPRNPSKDDLVTALLSDLGEI